MTAKYKIVVSDRQLGVLLEALEFYERVLGLGQVEELEWAWRAHADVTDVAFDERSRAIRASCEDIKKIGWHLGMTSSHSIHSNKVPVPMRIAYDMTQMLRKARAEENYKARAKEGQARRDSVDFRDYRSVYPDEPPLSIEVMGVLERLGTHKGKSND